MGFFSKKETKEYMMPYDLIEPQSDLDKKFGAFTIVAYGEVEGEKLYFVQFFKLPALYKGEYENIIKKMSKVKTKEVKVVIIFKDGKPTLCRIDVESLLGIYGDYTTSIEPFGSKIENEYPDLKDLVVF